MAERRGWLSGLDQYIGESRAHEIHPATDAESTERLRSMLLPQLVQLLFDVLLDMGDEWCLLGIMSKSAAYYQEASALNPEPTSALLKKSLSPP